MQRFMQKFKKIIWLNPYPKNAWQYTQSTSMIRELIEEQMDPMTIEGLEQGMSYLAK